jgi:glycerol-3-phosphate dehydrogenase (NAD(P)+)
MVIKIIGKGAWGRSIAQTLYDNGHTIHFLKKGQITLYNGDTVVLALPTNAIREALTHCQSVKYLRVINCTKGIEVKTHKLPFEIIRELLHPTTSYYSLLGPSYASELQEKMPTLINLGYRGNTAKAQAVKKLFETNYLRIHIVHNIPSLELAGAMKNICAIACGISDGLRFGMNTRTKLIIAAIEEYYLLCEALEYPIDEHALGGIIGDFMLTGNSETSRNFQFGKLIVRMPVANALKKINATVEGYASLPAIFKIIKQAHARIPLTKLVGNVIAGKKSDTIEKQFLTFMQSV